MLYIYPHVVTKKLIVHFKRFNLLKPKTYFMYHQLQHSEILCFCPQCIYVFCVDLRTNSDLCHLQHKLIGFYNRDEKCLLRGTD